MSPRLPFAPENVARRERAVSAVEVKVPSKSRPDKSHYVSLTATCTCEAFIYRSRCTHIAAVLDTLVGPAKG